ncbi:hypothetical protein SDC9_116353 [bioreactor metagenome]|uniref:Uncharacterized protein n=1 Tax=bioreactor metagenome TaxID=1076179 RepID=A0A645BWD1_9ZZZZ
MGVRSHREIDARDPAQQRIEIFAAAVNAAVADQQHHFGPGVKHRTDAAPQRRFRICGFKAVFGHRKTVVHDRQHQSDHPDFDPAPGENPPPRHLVRQFRRFEVGRQNRAGELPTQRHESIETEFEFVIARHPDGATGPMEHGRNARAAHLPDREGALRGVAGIDVQHSAGIAFPGLPHRIGDGPGQYCQPSVEIGRGQHGQFDFRSGEQQTAAPEDQQRSQKPAHGVEKFLKKPHLNLNIGKNKPYYKTIQIENHYFFKFLTIRSR